MTVDVSRAATAPGRAPWWPKRRGGAASKVPIFCECGSLSVTMLLLVPWQMGFYSQTDSLTRQEEWWKVVPAGPHDRDEVSQPANRDLLTQWLLLHVAGVNLDYIIIIIIIISLPYDFFCNWQGRSLHITQMN